MESLIPNQKGMTSLEIAEVTGKQHAHVMRDIRNLLSQGVAESNFGLGSYTDANGQERPLFNLTPKGCLILASGYDAVLREKIIDRLEYLENEKKAIQTPQTYLEALEALVASEKEKERLRIESEQQKKQIEQKRCQDCQNSAQSGLRRQSLCNGRQVRYRTGCQDTRLTIRTKYLVQEAS